MCSPISHHALTFLRAHYRALLKHTATIPALGLTLTAITCALSSTSWAVDSVIDVLNGKPAEQSWDEYLDQTKLDAWKNDWQNTSGYTVVTSPIKAGDSGNDSPNLSNTWLSVSSDKAYDASYPLSSPPKEISWNNVVVSASEITRNPLYLIGFSVPPNSNTSLQISNSLFFSQPSTSDLWRTTVEYLQAHPNSARLRFC